MSLPAHLLWVTSAAPSIRQAQDLTSIQLPVPKLFAQPNTGLMDSAGGAMPIPEAIARQAVAIPAPQFLQPFSAPLFGSRISAGFPSPAEDYVERNVDANELLITNKPATYFVWVAGQSMKGVWMRNGGHHRSGLQHRAPGGLRGGGGTGRGNADQAAGLRPCRGGPAQASQPEVSHRHDRPQESSSTS